jgi:hypothetical protein
MGSGMDDVSMSFNHVEIRKCPWLAFLAELAVFLMCQISKIREFWFSWHYGTFRHMKRTAIITQAYVKIILAVETVMFCEWPKIQMIFKTVRVQSWSKNQMMAPKPRAITDDFYCRLARVYVAVIYVK